ncbi:MAG TPA: PilT/PilU family type 4a pilus ATPase [Gammaproteobacteria bacterium]|nr:PilT/PilU family type 4a pilus ATPase [Gammaproteobacteria bacterium]
MTLESLLREAVRCGASDLFITAGAAPSIKAHGRISRLCETVLDAAGSLALVQEAMDETQQAEFAATREANFALERPGLGRFRVNVFQHQSRLGMVLRRIQTDIPAFADLHLPPELAGLSLAPRGLVLVVGATGAGKSTTLAAMVGHRNRHAAEHIVCIEDPIEFIHPSQGCIITQREVGLDTDSFEVALRNAMRQAPDVIVVGEIRSRVVMEQALTFAETGHLCLSTLHAANAVQALERMVHFVPRERREQVLLDLSLNLKAIVAQRLIPAATGQGRRVAVELLLNTPLAADLIRAGEFDELKSLMKRSGGLGMRTFDQAVLELYQTGEIGYDEALHHADSSNEVRLMIKLEQGAAQAAEWALAGEGG